MNLLSKTGSKLIAGLLAAAFILGFGEPSANAQNGSATVTASLVDPSVDAGQPAEYHIDVINGQPDRPPPTPQVDGLTISFVGRSQSRQFNFGNGFQVQQTVTQVYVYSIETSRPGRFTIPGQQIDVGGAVLRTLPITLTVLDAGAGGGRPPGLTLATELIIPKKSAYVGESILAEVRTYFGMSVIFRADPDPILNGEGFSAQKFTPPRLDTQVVQGTQVQVASYQAAITGVKTGTLSVGPVEVQPIVQMPRSRPRRQRYNDPFSDPFFNNAMDSLSMEPPKKVKLNGEPVAIEIKALPPGKPADFSGAIGTFKLDSEVSPRKAQAGDPVTVRLVLTGQGNFDRVSAPVLSDERGLRAYPPTAKFKGETGSLSGTKTFEQVVIADGARTTLPSYHFNFLDPATGKYTEIDTPTLPIEITGGNGSVAALAPTPVSAATPQTPPPLPKPAEDILYIRNDFGAAHSGQDFLPPYRRRSFWLMQGGIATVLLGIALLGGPQARARGERTRRLAQARRRQTELERTLKGEGTRRGEFYEAATQLVRSTAANGNGQTSGNLSATEVCRAKHLDAQTASSVEQIFRRYDELAYSGGPLTQEPVPADERRAVLATLETLNRA